MNMCTYKLDGEEGRERQREVIVVATKGKSSASMSL